MILEREIEHTTDGEAGELATLSEEQTNLVQMEKVAELTVEPGVMKLPVTSVDTAKNNERWSITVEHPVKGEKFFNMDKPTTWTEDQELVTLLRWYDIQDRDPYKLRTSRYGSGGYLYVQHEDANTDHTVLKDDSPHEWQLIEPPWMEKRREARRRQRSTREKVSDWAVEKAQWRPPKTPAFIWSMLFVSTLVSAALAGMAGALLPIAGTIAAILTAALLFVGTTVVTMAVTDPPTDGGGGGV